MYAFTFHRPQTVRQAAGLLGKNEEAKLLAGGHSLLPTMKLRLAGPPQLVDLSLIDGMAGHRCTGVFRSMEEALARVALDSPDVILVDIGLPGMSGTSPTRRSCSRRSRGWRISPA